MDRISKRINIYQGNIYKIKSNNKFRENFIKHFSEKYHFSEKLFTDNSKFMI